MSLEEYTNSDKETAFIYWIEKRTENAGSIWGGMLVVNRNNITDNSGVSQYVMDANGKKQMN